MDDMVLSLDIGTTLVKSVLFNTAGREVAVAEQPIALQTPHPTYAEQDGEQLWQAAHETLREAAAAAPQGGRVHAIVLASQAGSVIPLDEQGRPLYPFVTWIDTRADAIVQRWLAGDEAATIRRISGWNPAPGLSLPIIAWFRQHNPEIFRHAAHWLSPNDYLAFRLSGDYVTNPSMAGEMLMMELQSNAWSEELCRLGGISSEQLSTILPSNAVISQLSESAAELTGIPAGTPLVNGGQDHSCEALALGVTSSDTAFLGCGTAWVINAVNQTGNMQGIPPAMCLNPHVLPERWIASEYLGPLGSGPEWCIKHLWQAGSDSASRSRAFAEMGQALIQRQPQESDPLFLRDAETGKESHEPGTGSFIELVPHHDRVDRTRAVLENAIFAVRRSLDELRACQPELRCLWMIGGAARNPVWPQMLADTCDIEVRLASCSHGPALGAAMLVFVEMGLISDYETCRSRFALDVRCIQPDSGRKTFYDKRYERYRQALKASADK